MPCLDIRLHKDDLKPSPKTATVKSTNSGPIMTPEASWDSQGGSLDVCDSGAEMESTLVSGVLNLYTPMFLPTTAVKDVSMFLGDVAFDRVDIDELKHKITGIFLKADVNVSSAGDSGTCFGIEVNPQ